MPSPRSHWMFRCCRRSPPSGSCSAPSAARAAEDCLSCHDSEDNVGDAALVVDVAAFEATPHGAAGIACADCHAGHEEYPHAASDARVELRRLPRRRHRRARGERSRPPRRARPQAPGLRLLPRTGARAARRGRRRGSLVNPARLAQTCGACHSNPEMGAQEGIKLVQPIAAYEASVHAGGVAKGEKAATCSSCHGSHGILPGSDSASSVNRENVPATCAACHGEIADDLRGERARRRRRRGHPRVARSAPTATASTASSVPPTRARRCSPRTCRR